MIGQLLTALLLVTPGVFGAICSNPKATPATYSTTDAFFHAATTFIAEFTLSCDNDAKDVPLYAEVEGRLVPVAISEDTGKYQVSWTEEHDKARSGEYLVNVFDEDGYSALRKAQRENEDTSKVTPLLTVSHYHPGASRGAYVTSETVMTLAAGVIFYVAHSWRSQLQN